MVELTYIPNNSVIVLLYETDNKMYQRRLGNDLQTILEALAPYQETLRGLAVESTYNWYWLVDAGLPRSFGEYSSC